MIAFAMQQVIIPTPKKYVVILKGQLFVKVVSVKAAQQKKLNFTVHGQDIMKCCNEGATLDIYCSL